MHNNNILITILWITHQTQKSISEHSLSDRSHLKSSTRVSTFPTDFLSQEPHKNGLPKDQKYHCDRLYVSDIAEIIFGCNLVLKPPQLLAKIEDIKIVQPI